MKKICSIVTALIMALTVFIVPNLGVAFADNEEEALNAAAEDAVVETEEPEEAVEAQEEALEAIDVSLSGHTESSLTFSWKEVTGATGFRFSTDNATWTDLTEEEIANNAKELSGLESGTSYTFYLVAFDEEGNIASGKADGTTDADTPEVKPAPTKATTLKGTPGYTNIKYTWTAVDGADGYAIRRGTDDVNNNKYRDNESLSFNWTGLQQRTSHTFCVRAYVEVPEGTKGGVWINHPGTGVSNYKYVLFGPLAKVVVKTKSKERIERTKYDKGYVYKYYDKNGVYRGTCYSMWNTIKNKKSKSKYLIALDTRRNNIVIYKGKKGNWKPYKHFVCACGVADHRTPRGDFKIQSKKPKFQTGDKVGKVVVNAKYTCWYATKFHGAVFFHSTLYYLNSKTRHAARHVGKHYSHGCVRLEIKNAKWIYKNCKKGTAVISRKYGKDCSYGYVYSYKY